jgi:hypothetical protein
MVVRTPQQLIQEEPVRRRFIVPIIALALPLLFAPTVAAFAVQPPDMVAQLVGWNALYIPTNLVAQTFVTPNKVERLDSVEVFFHGTANGATVETWLHAGAPSTSSIAGTDVTANVVTPDNSWTALVPHTSVLLAANTEYSLMFRVTDGTHTTSFAGEDDGTSYSGGAAYLYNGSTWSTPVPNNVQDLSFKVLMSPLPGTMDQHQNVHDTSVGFAVSAQTFVAGVTGSLNAVSLWSDGADGSSPVTVELCTGTTGIDCAGAAPTVVKPAVVATGVLGSSALVVPSNSVQWFNFVFSSPIPITAGTHYAIVVLGDAAWAGTAANTYGNGAAYGNEGSWGALNGAPVQDLTFQTYVTPGSSSTLPPTSSAGAGSGSTTGGSVPMPLLLGLMAAMPVVAAVLAKRSVVRTSR